MQTVGDNQRYSVAIAILLLGISSALALILESWKTLGVGGVLFLTFCLVSAALPAKNDRLEEPLTEDTTEDTTSAGDNWRPPNGNPRPPDHQIKASKGIG